MESTPNMGPRSVSLTLWAFTDLPTPRQDVIRALCEAGAREAGGMCGQGIANSLRALVAFNVDPREPAVQLFIDALCRRCVKTLPVHSSHCTLANVARSPLLPGLNPHALYQRYWHRLNPQTTNPNPSACSRNGLPYRSID